MITFFGEGNHTIYGSGSLTLKCEIGDLHNWTSVQLINIVGVNGKVTFKDTKLNLSAYQRYSAAICCGFYVVYGASLIFDNCDVSITTVNGKAAVESYGNVSLRNCYLTEGTCNGGGIVDANNNDMSEITIEKTKLYIHNVSFSYNELVVGQVLDESITVNGEHYTVGKVSWYAIYSGDYYPVSEGHTVQLSNLYEVIIHFKPDMYYGIANDVTATINGHNVDVIVNDDDYQIRYTLPSLE